MHIKGIGMAKFNVDNVTKQDMMYQAILEALEDADTNIDDLNAIGVSSEDTQNNGIRQRLIPCVLASILKAMLPIIRVPAICGSGGGTTSVHTSDKVSG